MRFWPVPFLAAVFCFAAATPFPQPPQEKPAPPAPDYSREPFVIEHYEDKVRFENDGTGTEELTVRVRLESEAGVQPLGELVFGYNSASERLDVVYARVHKADGSVVAAAPDAVKDLTAPVAREAPVYTDAKEKHLSVPALRPGDLLEYQIVRRIEHPVAPGEFWLERNFITEVIVLDEQLEINLPRGRAVKLKTQPGAEPQITDEGDRRIYRWTSSHRQREPAEETKKKKQPGEPKPPAVQLTTFPNWEGVGRWYAALERDRITPGAGVRAKALELVAGRSPDLEKVEVLYDYVAKNLRYVSLSFGVGRYQPHPAGEVLRNGYGDCKDKHTLLAAMLAAVGLRADAALINSSRAIDPDVPSPAQFDHVISVVPLGDQAIWLDSTTGVAPFRLLSANLRGKKALLVPPEGAGRLAETGLDPPFPSTQRVEIDARVSALGKLTARAHYALRGDNELALRATFRRTPQAQWKEIAQLVAILDGFRGEVSEVKANDPAATENPFEFEFEVSQPSYLDWAKRKATLALPLPAIGMPEADEESTALIKLGTPLEVVAHLKLDLPPNYTVTAPVGMVVARDYAEYHASYKVAGNVITAERTLRFKLRELPAERASDYAAFVHAVRSDERQELGVESTVAGMPTIPATAKADELHEAGIVALGNGNFQDAAELFKRVVELEPKHKWAWNNLGRAYLGLNRVDDAISAFGKQIEVNPYDEYAYNNLGLALERQQKFDEAAAAFRKQIEVSPLDRYAHASLGSLHLQQHKYAEAVPELEKATALNPDQPILRVELGRAYLNLGQNDKALAAFEKGVEAAPGPPVWNNVAYELAQHRLELDRAQQYAESAVAATAAALRNVELEHLTPGDLARTASLAAYWDTLGWVYFARGDLDRAEKFVTAAWELDQHGEVGDHLAQIYEKRGHNEDAIRTYALALAASHGVPETRGRLAALLGSDAKVDPLVNASRGQLSTMRAVKLGPLLKEHAAAEFFVLLSPGPKVKDVKLISGDDKLRGFAENLRSAKYPQQFPDDTPTRVVRRGVLSCSAATGGCAFVLYLAEDVRSVN